MCFWGIEMGDLILVLWINVGVIYVLIWFSGNSYVMVEWLVDFFMNCFWLVLDFVFNFGIMFNYEENYCLVYLVEVGGGGILVSVRVFVGYCDVDWIYFCLKFVVVVKCIVLLGFGISMS